MCNFNTSTFWTDSYAYIRDRNFKVIYSMYTNGYLTSRVMDVEKQEQLYWMHLCIFA